MNKLKELIKNEWVQLILMLVGCILIGNLLSPVLNFNEKSSEHIVESYKLKLEESEKRRVSETQELQQKLQHEQQSRREYEEEVSRKVEKLTQENSSLKQSMKKQKFKIIKPDGTIVEKEIEESNSEATKSVVTQVREEFTRKVKEIEDRWKKIHEERVSKLQAQHEEELKKAKSEVKTVEVVKEVEKRVEVNKKALRPEIGLSTDRNIYLHGTYNVLGPIFLGGGVSGTQTSFGDARIGVGIQF